MISKLALEELYKIIDDDGFTNNQTGFRIVMELVETIQKDLDKLEKLEKVIKILKKKKVLVGLLINSENVKEYNTGLFQKNYSKQYYLTQEEYNLLKEVIENA